MIAPPHPSRTLAMDECRATATVSVFAAVLAPIFATLAAIHMARPPGHFPPFRDGTDPLLGGHGAAPGCRGRLAVIGAGGAS
jgi:hypothetical protein